MTHHSAAQQQERFISVVCLSARNTGELRLLLPLLLLMDTSAGHSLLRHMPTWRHMEVCHQNMSAVSHVQNERLQQREVVRRNDERSSNCVWRKMCHTPVTWLR